MEDNSSIQNSTSDSNPFMMSDKEAQENNKFITDRDRPPATNPPVANPASSAMTRRPNPEVKNKEEAKRASTFFRGRTSVKKWEVGLFLGKRDSRKNFSGDIDKNRLVKRVGRFFGDKSKNFFTRRDLEKVQRTIIKEKVYKEAGEKRADEKFLKGVNDMLK